MAVRCIALDLDWTTLMRGGALSAGNRSALQYAIEKGVHIVVATGRAFGTIPAEIREIPGIEYAITSNGAAVYRISDGSCIKEHQLPPDAPGRILDLTADFSNITYECFIHGKAYGAQEYLDTPARFNASELSVEYMRTTRTMMPDIRAFIRAHAHELNCLDVLVPDADVNRRVYGILKTHLTGVYMTSSYFQLVELSAKESGKANGLRFVADLLGLRRDELAAFGDGDNDSEMLRFAGTGIAVGNATQGCIAAADHVTRRHDEDGVAWGIREILRI